MPRPPAAVQPPARPALLGLVALALMGLGLACAREPAPEPRVADPASLREAPAGPVVGFVDRYGAHAWLGIPYAAPPVGARRWRPPEPAPRWSDPREALRPGAACPQFASPLGGVPDAEPGTLVGDEDCLTLNVYAPRAEPEDARARRLPVMLWIHGGGNTIGTARFYHGGRLAAEQEVVVVMANYRLGPFGWFRHPALTGEGASGAERSGNWGTLDLVRALAWVRENAPAFGGDPDNVTIFGESAGGHNVVSLLVSPAARGLFHRAIVQSGSARGTTVAEAENPADAEPPGHPRSAAEILRTLLVDAGRADGRVDAARLAASMAPGELARFLRDRSPAEIFAAYRGEGFGGMIDMPRVILDGTVLPAEGLGEALVAGRGAPVPVMLGSNRDEMKLFLFVDPEYVRRWFGVLPQVKDEEAFFRRAEYESLLWKAAGVDELAAPLAARRPGSVFAYRFDWDEEPRILWADLGELVGAAHGFEIPFVFGHWELGRQGRVLFSEENAPGREALSAAMRGYWASFALAGDPGRGGRPDGAPWEPWDASSPDAPKYVLLDTPEGGGIRMARDTVTVDELVARVRTDPRFETAEARCAMLARMVERSWTLDEGDWPRVAGGLCAERPAGLAAR